MGLQPDFEVRPDQLDLVPVRLHQDVRQDRHGVPLLDDALEKLKFIQNVLFEDRKFHGFTPNTTLIILSSLIIKINQ
jgi:hypothetical protein